MSLVVGMKRLLQCVEDKARRSDAAGPPAHDPSGVDVDVERDINEAYASGLGRLDGVSAGGRDSYEPAIPVAAGAVSFNAERCGERADIFRGDDCAGVRGGGAVDTRVARRHRQVALWRSSLRAGRGSGSRARSIRR